MSDTRTTAELRIRHALCAADLEARTRREALPGDAGDVLSKAELRARDALKALDTLTARIEALEAERDALAILLSESAPMDYPVPAEAIEAAERVIRGE